MVERASDHCQTPDWKQARGGSKAAAQSRAESRPPADASRFLERPRRSVERPLSDGPIRCVRPAGCAARLQRSQLHTSSHVSRRLDRSPTVHGLNACLVETGAYESRPPVHHWLLQRGTARREHHHSRQHALSLVIYRVATW